MSLDTEPVDNVDEATSEEDAAPESGAEASQDETQAIEELLQGRSPEQVRQALAVGDWWANEQNRQGFEQQQVQRARQAAMQMIQSEASTPQGRKRLMETIQGMGGGTMPEPETDTEAEEMTPRERKMAQRLEALEARTEAQGAESVQQQQSMRINEFSAAVTQAGLTNQDQVEFLANEVVKQVALDPSFQGHGGTARAFQSALGKFKRASGNGASKATAPTGPGRARGGGTTTAAADEPAPKSQDEALDAFAAHFVSQTKGGD